MSRDLKWHRRFVEMAQLVSTWSKDPSTQVGAVLVDDDLRVLAVGYNGFPREVRDLDERLMNRDVKYMFTVHAEANACISAGHLARGSTLYVWPTFGFKGTASGPCNECCKTIIQSGVSRVVMGPPDFSRDFSRWEESMKVSDQMLREARVDVVVLQPED